MSSKEEFNKEADYYQMGLDQAGYKDKLQFKVEEERTTIKKSHRRKVIWYNHPFASNIPTKSISHLPVG